MQLFNKSLWRFIPLLAIIFIVIPFKVVTAGATYNVDKLLTATPTPTPALPPAPFAVSLHAQPASGAAPLTVNFIAFVEGVNPQAVEFVDWDFGDGTAFTTNTLDLAHTYQQPGTYTATVTVSHPDSGQTATDTVTIVVDGSLPETPTPTPALPPAPFAVSLHAQPASGTAPLTVNFIAFVEGINPQAVEFVDWDFGDGTAFTTNTLDLAHTYQQPGTYTATVTVSHPDSDQTATDTVTIVVDGSLPETPTPTPTPALPPAPFAVSLHAQPASGAAPLTVNFIAFVEGVNPQAVEFVDWDFGDGTAFTTNTLDLAHTYQQPGTYTATVTVSHPDSGQTATDTVTIVVDGSLPETPTPTPTPALPPAPFAVSLHAQPASGAAPLTVNFIAFVEGVNPQAVEFVDWDFGDGTAFTTNTLDLAHTYQQPGTYTATVTVSHPDSGQTATDTVTIVVDGSLPETPTPTPTPALPPAPVQVYLLAHPPIGIGSLNVEFSIIGADPANITEVVWDFDDGTSATTTALYTTHHYQRGFWQPQATIYTIDGTSISTQTLVIVIPKFNWFN